MRKLLTAGIFGTILGIVGAGTVNASIVSSGFLDEKLTEYALSTSLDLKANQSDLTALSNKVGTLPSGDSPMFAGYEFLFPWIDQPLPYPTSLEELITAIYGFDDGVPGLLAYIIGSFRTDINNDGNPDMNVGLIPNFVLANDAKNLANANATKIGTLPEGITVQGMYEGWTDSNDGTTYLGVKDLNTKTGTLPTEIVIGNSNGSIDMFNIMKSQRVSLPKDYTLSDFIQDMYYGSFGVNVGLGTSPFYGLSDIINHVMYGGIIGEASPDLTGKQYKGLIDLTREINKIGDLPTEIPNVNSIWNRYGFVEGPGTPIDLPDTIGGMFAMLFNEDTSYNGPSLASIMVRILMGFEPPFGRRIEGLANLTSVYELVGDSPIVTAVNANTAKIGDLPTEYATVGAALTAIKGIAEDAKAAALAAIPDPKQEGSSGKFVLTVDIVGDNATYHWEKIDREGETTTTE